jgi:O-antigen/teichoic acid export membrane protein
MSYIGAVNAVAFGAGVIRQKAFAVCLSPAGLGAFSLAASFLELLVTVGRLGAPTGLLREFTRSLRDGHSAEAARVFLDVRRLVIGLVLAFGVCVALLTPWITGYLFVGALPWWTIPVLVVAAPLLLNAQLCGSVMNGMGRIRVLSLYNLLTVLSGLVVTVWLVVSYGLTGAILQLASGAILAAFIAQAFLDRTFRPSDHRPELVQKGDARRAVTAALRVGMAETLHWVVAATNLFVFRLVVATSIGTYANGLYQGTMGLSRQYTATLAAGIFIYLYPRLVRLAGDSESFARELARSVGFALAIIVPVSLGLVATRDWIVRFVFTGEFSAMVPLMVYSFPGDVAEVLVGILRAALLASGSARSYLIVGFLEQGLYLGMFLAAFKFFGLTGAIAAYLVSGIFGLLMYGIVLAKRGEFRVTGRLLSQLLLTMPTFAVVALSELGTWRSRGLAAGLALVWMWGWRREILSGLRK